ncbi:MAG: sugar phosphate isomerase/epimerase [Clostridiales bacterium]|jgi:sugar phosphate isomerase/epimerase|nr:sugar phosphate isomerase/epimerase [Clostridiales bacterium]
MKIGMCAKLENIEFFESMGFDYLELSVTSFASLEESEWRKAVEKVESLRIGVEAFNGFIPKQVPLVGPNVDLKLIREYMTRAVSRSARLGARVIVLGSGDARRVPPGFDAEKARSQLSVAASIAGEIASACSITISIEPLNSGETNLINFLPEACALVKEIGRPSISVLADYYHMRKGSEPMSNVLLCGSLLSHAHIARKDDRGYPLPGDGEEYGSFFDKLKDVDYQGRLSIEARSENPSQDGPRSLAYLGGLAAKAGF